MPNNTPPALIAVIEDVLHAKFGKNDTAYWFHYDQAQAALLAAIRAYVVECKPGLGADTERLEKNELELAEYTGYAIGVTDYATQLLQGLGGTE